jgi:hypothetical protein
MKDRYLEVTFREGTPLAAYLYLPRNSGAKSCRSQPAGQVLVVDLDAQGTPIGIEITAPGQITVQQINEVLAGFGLPALDERELTPVAAA